jgi:monoamine oxidase
MPPPYATQPGITKIIPYNVSPSPIWSHVTSSQPNARIITTAGQIGQDAEGNIPSDPDEQIALAFYNLQQCLEAAGARVEDVLKLTYYIVHYDSKNRRHTNHLLKFLDGHKPATTLVPVTALAVPEYVFEIEATASILVEPHKEVDVVVVGGGLSGLKAAWDVQKAGFSCVVLEARNRLGGKTWSQDSRTGKVDVGAAWINDSNQSYVWELVKEFGLETVIQNTNGKMTVENGDTYQTAKYGELLAVRLSVFVLLLLTLDRTRNGQTTFSRLDCCSKTSARTLMYKGQSRPH